MSEKTATKRELEIGLEDSIRLRNLRSAVEGIYYSAVWHADRPVNEIELWTTLRDAAGFRPGNSPAELPYPGVRFDFSLDRIRVLANVIGKRNDFSTEQVNAFLSLYREEFEAHVNKAAREFIERKLG